MAITTGTLSIKDGGNTSRLLKTINDSADSTVNPVHGILDAGGNIIGGNAPLAIHPSPKIVAANATMTRPADTTTYAFGDLVANNTTAGSVTPFTIAAARANDVPGMIVGGRLKKTTTTTSVSIFRIHLFNASPSVANGDNGAFTASSNANYLGFLDVSVNEDTTDGAFGLAVPYLLPAIPFIPASGTQNIFALIEARAAYVPGNAEVFTLELLVL